MGLGPELVTNGHFNVDTTGWSALNGGVLSSEAGGIDSSNALKVLSGAANAGSAYQTVNVKAGRKYVLSQWHKNGSTSGKISLDSTASTWNGDIYYEVFVDAAWTFRSSVIECPTNIIAMTLFNNSTTLGHYNYWDNISVREIVTRDGVIADIIKQILKKGRGSIPMKYLKSDIAIANNGTFSTGFNIEEWALFFGALFPDMDAGAIGLEMSIDGTNYYPVIDPATGTDAVLLVSGADPAFVDFSDKVRSMFNNSLAKLRFTCATQSSGAVTVTLIQRG